MSDNWTDGERDSKNEKIIGIIILEICTFSFNYNKTSL